MFRFFFSLLLIVIFKIFREVLKFFPFSWSCFLSRLLDCPFSYSFSFFPVILLVASDETTYYSFACLFDFFFFLQLVGLFDSFCGLGFFLFYFLLFGLVNIYFFFVFPLIVFFLLGVFLYFMFFFIFIFFVLLSFCFNLFDFFFSVKLFNLFLFSRDVIALEEEDLWISSNLFYFDNKIVKSKDFKTTLNSHEVEVFYTLLKLFFDVPLKNKDYRFFSKELADFRNSYVEKRNLRNFFNKPYRPSISLFGKKSTELSKRVFKTSNKFFFGKRISSHFFFFLFRLFNFYSPKARTLKLQNKYARRRNFEFFKMRTVTQSKKAVLAHKKSDSTLQNINLQDSKLMDIVKVSTANEFKLLGKYLQFVNFGKVSLRYSEKFSPALFHFFKTNAYHSQYPELSRFQKFFWFSFPFYIVEFGFLWNSNIFKVLVTMLRAVISRFLYLVFFLLGEPLLDVNPLFLYTFRDYKPLKKKLDFLKFLELGGENVTDKSFVELLVSEINGDSKIDVGNVNKVKESVSEDSVNKKKKKGFESVKKKEQRLKIFRSLKGTREKDFLVSLNRYRFVNKYNITSKRAPNLSFLNTYQLLEYFYFVLTNDSDFHENAVFDAKVFLLRETYGQAIVNDLLSRADHKQAAKVSVIMHVTDVESFPSDNVIPNDNSKLNQTETFSDSISENDSFVTENFSSNNMRSQNAFPQASSSSNSIFVSNFKRDLYLSYKHRFR